MARPRYSVNSRSYTTKWLKNAMRSIGASYGDNIKSLAPNLYEISSTGAKTATQVARSIRTNRNGNEGIANALKNNKYVKFAQAAYRNALVDIKSGNLNNKEREASSFEGISDAVEEAMSGFTFGDDGADKVNVNIIGNAGDESGLAGLSSQMAKQSEANAKMQKANMDAFVAVNAASMQQVGQIGAEVVNQLTNINSQLAAMVQYNNTSMNKYIEASLAYMDRVGSSVEKMSSSDSSHKITAMDVIGSASKGGINLGRYKQMVKQQFKGMVDNSEFGVLKTLLDDDMFISQLVNNPIGASTRMLTSYMMPKMLKTTLEGMETTLNNFMPDMLMQVSDLAKDQSTGIAGMIKRAIGQTFGIKVDRTNNSKGAKINRGPVPFDGETKHAITEIITKELREQTGYLQIIAENYKKDAKSHVKSNAEYWDWTKNKYIKGSDINSSITNKMMDTVYESMSGTYFGKNLAGVIDQGRTKDSKNDIESTLKEFYSLMEQQSQHLDLADLMGLVQKTNGSPTAKKLVKNWLKKMRQQSPNDFNNRSAAQIGAQTSMKELRDELISNPTLYHLLDSDYANSENIDQVFNNFVFNEDNARNTKHVKFDQKAGYSASQRSSSAGKSKSYSNIGKTETGQKLVNAFAKAGGYANDIMNNIMSGNVNGVIEARNKAMQEALVSVGSSLSKTLFGTKDSNNRFEHGIFSDVSNKFTDVASSMKYKLTGKGYTDSNGKRYEDNEESVFGKLTSIGTDIKNSVVEKLFGRTMDDSGNYQHTKHGIVDTIGDQFKSAANSFKEFLFGVSTGDYTNDRRNKGLLQNVKNAFEKNFYGGKKNGSDEGRETDITNKELFGQAALGTFGGGILGYMVGGPVLGSMAGLALTIRKNSDKFKTLLFGEENGLTLANGKTAKKQGLLGKVGNYLKANVGTPIKNELAYIFDDVRTTIKHDILSPLAFTAEYAAGKIGKVFGGIGSKAKFVGTTAAKFVGTTIAEMFPGLTEKVGKLTEKGLDGVYQFGASIVKAPFKFLSATVKALGINDRIKAFFKPVGDILKKGAAGIFTFTKDVIKDSIRLALSPASLAFKGIKKGASFLKGKISNSKFGQKFAAAYKKDQDTYDDILEENDRIITENSPTDSNGNPIYTQDTAEARDWFKKNDPDVLNQLKDTLDIRMKLNKRDGKLEHKKNKEVRNMNRLAQKNASKIARWTKGQFSADTQEAREWLKLHDPQKLKELDDTPYNYFKAEQEKANIVKNGRSSRGMSESQLAKASLMSMSEQGQTNALLARIWDMMFKQTHDGKDKDEVDAEEAEQNFLNDISTNRTNRRAPLSKSHKTKLIQEYYAKGGDTASKEEQKQIIRELANRYNCTQKEVRNAINNGDEGGQDESLSLDTVSKRKVLGSYALGDIANLVDSAKSRIRSVLSDPDRQHANGGKLKKGLNLVGEDGAELVDSDSKEVIPAEETMSILNVRSASMRNAFRKSKNAKTLKKEKEESKYKAAILSATERTAKASEEGTEETKKHGINWNKIFSKKGLVTGAIIAGALLFKKYLPDVLTTAGKVIGTVAKGISWLFNIISGTYHGQEANENGENAIEIADNIIDNATDGNILQINDDGSASSLTTPTTKVLARAGLNMYHGAQSAKYGTKAVSRLSKLAEKIPVVGKAAKIANAEKTIGSTAYKVGSKISSAFTKKAGSTVATEAGEEVAESASKALIEKAGTKVTSETVETATKSTAKGFKNTLKTYITKFFTWLKSKFVKKVGSELADDALGKVTEKAVAKGVDKLSEKVTVETGEKVAASVTSHTASAAASFGISEAVFATIGAINGVSGTAQLFKCKKEDVDGTMRLVAGIFGALTGTTLGSIIDIIFAVVSAVLGIDILNSLAVALYTVIVGKDSEKAQKLADSQDELYSDYEDERDAKIEEQYNTQKKAGLISSDMTLAEFTEGISNGTVSAKYEGFDNYNTRVNGSFLDKGISAVGKGLKYTGHGISTAWQKVFTGEKVLTDSNGNTYTKNADGTYQVTSANGEDLGYISKDALPDDITTTRKQSALSKAGSAIKTGVTTFNNWAAGNRAKLKETVFNTKDKLVSIAQTVRSGISTAFGNAKDFGTDFVSRAKSYVAGDSDEVYEDDNTSFSTTKALNVVSKMVLGLPRGIMKIGKGIKSLWGNVKDTGSDFVTAAKNYIKGNTDDFELETDGDETNPITSVLSGMSGIFKIILTPIRLINKLFGGIKDTVSNLVDSGSTIVSKAGDVVSGAWNTVKTGASNAWSTAKNTVSGLWNSLTGGSGPGMSLNGGTYYSQADPRWSSRRYGFDGATMADSGCGPAAAAMALSDVTGRSVSPVDMAGLAQVTGDRDSTGTNWNFMSHAASAMGVPSTQTVNPTAFDIDSALDSGRPVILSGNSGGFGISPYTSAGHYVVAVGRDRNGNILINDPRGASYSGAYKMSDILPTTGSVWSFGGNGNSNKRKKVYIKGGAGTNSATNTGSTTNSFTRRTSAPDKTNKYYINYKNGGYNTCIVMDSTNGFVLPNCVGYAHGRMLETQGIQSVDWNIPACNAEDWYETAKKRGLSVGLTPRLGAVICWSKGTKHNGSDGAGHVAFVEDIAADGTITISESGYKTYLFKTETVKAPYSKNGYTFEGFIYPYIDFGTSKLDEASFDSSYTNSMSTSDASVASNSSNDTNIFGVLGSFISSFASKALTGMATGKWNTDYSDVFGTSTNATSSNVASTSSTTGTSNSSGSTWSYTGNKGSSKVDTNWANSTGNTNKQRIWNFLTKKKGYSKNAAAGIMGNMQAESGFVPNNLQNGYESKLGYTDTSYTSAVDNGTYNNFVKDSAGYGLVQWTYYAYKQALLDYAKEHGKSIGDLDLQLNFLNKQMSGSSTLSNLNGATDPGTAARIFMTQFERPADQSEASQLRRAGYAATLMSELGGSGIGRRKYGGHGQRKVIRGGKGASASYSSSLTSGLNASTGASYSDYITVTKESSTTDIMINCLKVLAQIATNTGTTSSKLDLLKNLSSSSSTNVSITGNGTSATSKKTSSSSNNSYRSTEAAASAAQQIARGGY